MLHRGLGECSVCAKCRPAPLHDVAFRGELPIFGDCSIDTTMLRRRLRRRLGRGIKHAGDSLRRSDRSRVLFQQAEATSSGTVRPLDLLVAILKADLPEVTSLLADSGVGRERLFTAATKLLEAVRMETPKAAIPRQKAQRTLVDIFGHDLTHLAKTGQLEPIIGRKDEIRRLAPFMTRLLMKTRSKSSMPWRARAESRSGRLSASHFMLCPWGCGSDFSCLRLQCQIPSGKKQRAP